MSAAPLLTIYKDGQAVKSQEVEGEVILGRSEGCVLRINDRVISREHALFRSTEKGIEVQKKSEFASLKFNGTECTHAVIKEGDVIDIGPYQVRMSKRKEMQKDIPREELKDPERQPQSFSEPLSLAPISQPVLELVPLELPIQIPEEAVFEATNQSQDRTKVLSPDELQVTDQSSFTGPELTMESVPADKASNETKLQLGSPGEFTLLEAEGGTGIEMAKSEGFDFNASNPDQKTQVGIENRVPSVEDDGRTRVTTNAALDVKLVFEPGSANVDEIAVGADPISIGRGKECTVVLTDKKSSRKHAVVERRGMQIMIKDLNSANGTYVDGKKITEVQLSGNSRIQIGSAVFNLIAENANFTSEAQGYIQPVTGKDDVPELTFNSAPPQNSLPLEIATPDFGNNSSNQQDQVMNPIQMQSIGQPQNGTGMMNAGFNGQYQNQQGSQPQIAGLGGGRQGFYEKYVRNFSSLSSIQKIMVLLVGGSLVYFLVLDEDPVAKKKSVSKKIPGPQSSAVAAIVPTKSETGLKGKDETWEAAFEQLSSEKKKFIIGQHELAFNYYKNREYDKTLFEIRKIFSIIPEYKNAKEIERYAEEGKRKIEALQEEQRKKDDESTLKAKVATLVGEARARVAEKAYDQAKEIFVEILSLDPENKIVSELKLIIRADEENQQEALEREKIRREVNKRAWAEFNQGMALFKAEKFQKSILVFTRVLDIEVTDKKISGRVNAQIALAKQGIADKRDPLLEQGKKLEAGLDLTKAYRSYQLANQADPDSKEPVAGMDRIRGVLHAKAKILYTEAVLAESYSDFDLAKRKFEECLNTVPDDDIYYERAKRKLSTFTMQTTQESSSEP